MDRIADNKLKSIIFADKITWILCFFVMERKKYTRSFCKCMRLSSPLDSKSRAPVKWQQIYVSEGGENYIHIMFVSFHCSSTDSVDENTVQRNLSMQYARTLKDQCTAPSQTSSNTCVSIMQWKLLFVEQSSCHLMAVIQRHLISGLPLVMEKNGDPWRAPSAVFISYFF